MNISGERTDEVRTHLHSLLEDANIPILLMVLFQLTGSKEWLDDERRPSRARGLNLNASGGYDSERQRLIRDAAERAVLRWLDGEPAAVEVPDDKLVAKMLSICVGDDVDEEYGPLLSMEIGFVRPAVPHVDHSALEKRAADPHVIIVGAGVSGLGLAVELRRAGIPIKVLERRHDLGGTWLDNRYPGVGVDTPSFLYSYSYFSHPWPRYFSSGDNVHDYLTRFAGTYGLGSVIDFDRTVSSATWDAERRRWEIASVDSAGNEHVDAAPIVVTAVGQLSEPYLPDVPGRDDFNGLVVHSATWPAGLDLHGKRVAIVGSGASAMQLAPAIVDEVAELVVVQRSPQWVAPNEDRTTDTSVDARLAEIVPFYRAWHRAMLWWAFGDRIHDSLRVDPEWTNPDRSVNAINDGHRAFFTRYIEEQLEGRGDLLAQSVPSYPPFGKRMLLDTGWYQALKRPNCRLVTGGLAGYRETGIVTSTGMPIDVDVVVLATGFHAQRLLSPMEIVGRDHRSIRDVWGDDDPSAYLGMNVPGFPNMFVMYGPNTNLGHGGSYVFLAECQARYIVDLVTQALNAGIREFECKQEVHDDYNARVDEAHERLVWTHRGMQTWYRNARGRVVTNSPWRLVDFWTMTRHAELSDFELRGVTPDAVT